MRYIRLEVEADSVDSLATVWNQKLHHMESIVVTAVFHCFYGYHGILHYCPRSFSESCCLKQLE